MVPSSSIFRVDAARGVRPCASGKPTSAPVKRDVLLGAIEGCPFYVGASQFEYWAFFQISVDVTAGGGDSFSIEAPEGVRFIVRSRPFTDAEAAELVAEGPLAGPDAAA